MRPELDDIPEDMKEYMKLFMSRVNINTERIMSKAWKPNVRKNIKKFGKYFKDWSLEKLKGKHDGSAFLVGAGPSLKKEISELKKKEGVKIVCSHALKFCLKEGLRPDYVIVVDGLKEQIKFLDVDPRGLILIADIGVNHKALKNWINRGGLIFWFRMSTFKSINDIVDKMTDFKYEVTAGGSVISFGTILVQGLGFEKVYFLGTDLCNSGFADGSKGYKQTEIMCCDIHGMASSTIIGYYMHKFFIEGQTKNTPSIEWFNACGSGILGSYVQGNVKWIKQIKMKDI